MDWERIFSWLLIFIAYTLFLIFFVVMPIHFDSDTPSDDWREGHWKCEEYEPLVCNSLSEEVLNDSSLRVVKGEASSSCVCVSWVWAKNKEAK